MHWLLLSAAVLFTLPAAHAEVRVWNFRVLLDGSEIGKHTVTLGESGNNREVHSKAQFDVRVLFFSAYQYRHEAIERWQNNCLQSLVARTETNGERETVKATALGERFVIQRQSKRIEYEGCIMSFAYWNPNILRARRLLNAQTGELVPVTVNREGEEAVTVSGQSFFAQRHRITGSRLQIDLWYAGDRWVALEALTTDGRRLRYELTSTSEIR